jgi:hypothetical protein
MWDKQSGVSGYLPGKPCCPAHNSGSWDVVDFHGRCPIGVESNVESTVDHVGIGLDV